MGTEYGPVGTLVGIYTPAPLSRPVKVHEPLGSPGIGYSLRSRWMFECSYRYTRWQVGRRLGVGNGAVGRSQSLRCGWEDLEWLPALRNDGWMGWASEN